MMSCQLNSIESSRQNLKLTPSQRQVVITLLDKGKDRSQRKLKTNILLLNIDYKIAMKAQSAKHFLTEVQTFGKMSGLKLNKSKTDSFRQVTKITIPVMPGPSTPMRILVILGNCFSYDKEDCNKCNF